MPGEPKFEGQNQEEKKIDERVVKQMEEVINSPREKWIREEALGPGAHMISFCVNLPGGECFEEWIKDEDSKTFLERDPKFYTDKYGGADRLSKNLTPKQFAAIIEDALIKTGIDIKKIREENKRISEIKQKIDELDKKRKTKEVNEELRRLAGEFSIALGEINYDAAPAALYLFREGYTRTEIF